MTAPTTPRVMPETYYDAPPLNPLGGGLYTAATLNPEGSPSRFYGGRVIRPVNCAPGYGTFEADICVEPDEPLKGGRLAPLAPFYPVGVWAADECDLTEPDVEARARQTLRLKESVLVESAFAERLIADQVGAVPTRPDIVSVVAELEAQLGEFGFAGVIHASARTAAFAADHNLIVRSGAQLKTPLGHTWAFGGGYTDVLGARLVATGPVTIWQDEIAVRMSSLELAGQSNENVAIAERGVLVGYECYVAAVAVA